MSNPLRVTISYRPDPDTIMRAVCELEFCQEYDGPEPWFPKQEEGWIAQIVDLWYRQTDDPTWRQLPTWSTLSVPTQRAIEDDAIALYLEQHAHA